MPQARRNPSSAYTRRTAIPLLQHGAARFPNASMEALGTFSRELEFRQTIPVRLGSTQLRVRGDREPKRHGHSQQQQKKNKKKYPSQSPLPAPSAAVLRPRIDIGTEFLVRGSGLARPVMVELIAAITYALGTKDALNQLRRGNPVLTCRLVNARNPPTCRK